MTIKELKNIQTGLNGLSEIPTSLALVLARNLSKVNSAIKHADEDYQTAIKVTYVKDEAGEAIKYIADQTGNIKQDEAGNEIIFKSLKETPLTEGDSVAYKFADIKIAEEIRKEYEEQEHTVDFNIINAEKLDEAIKTGLIPAQFLTPLIGNIIPE